MQNEHIPHGHHAKQKPLRNRQGHRRRQVSAAKHTPGPWVLRMPPDTCESHWAEIDGGPEPRWEGSSVMRSHGQIATVCVQMDDDKYDDPYSEKLRANARLIAAAPDMLAALHRANSAL